MKWGGKVWLKSEVTADKVRYSSITSLDDEHYLGRSVDDPKELDEYFNHSCNPNMWLLDERTVAVRLPIKTDEELTWDISMGYDEDYILIERCQCRSDLCRGKVTLQDWKLEDLQQRYRGHFLPYINKKKEAIKSVKT